MPLGIRKPGQGYWVRVLSAIGVGVLVLAGAAWAYEQAKTVKIPARSWTFTLVDARPAGGAPPAPGDTVVLLGYEGASDELSETGSATIASYEPGRGTRATLVIDGFDSDRTRDFAGDAEQIRVGPRGEPVLTAAVRSAVDTPMYPVLYLQTGAALAVILLGAIGIYLFAGSTRSSVDFLIATDGEMKKVNWSSYREVRGMTIVVIVATFLIAGILYLVDIGFSWFFGAIGVLER